MTNFEVSENGLESLTIDFIVHPNFLIRSILLHNTFNKNLIKKYSITVDKLKFQRPKKVCHANCLKDYTLSAGGHVWYIDEWNLTREFIFNTRYKLIYLSENKSQSMELCCNSVELTPT